MGGGGGGLQPPALPLACTLDLHLELKHGNITTSGFCEASPAYLNKYQLLLCGFEYMKYSGPSLIQLQRDQTMAG